MALTSFSRSVEFTLEGLMVQRTYSEVQQQPYANFATAPAFTCYFDGDGNLVTPNGTSSTTPPTAPTVPYVYAVSATVIPADDTTHSHTFSVVVTKNLVTLKTFSFVISDMGT